MKKKGILISNTQNIALLPRGQADKHHMLIVTQCTSYIFQHNQARGTHGFINVIWPNFYGATL